MEKYCSVIGQRVKPDSCGTFKGCGDPAQCGLRSYYGWADYFPVNASAKARQEAQQQIKRVANNEADPEPQTRVCNVCGQRKPLTRKYFNKGLYFDLACKECKAKNPEGVKDQQKKLSAYSKTEPATEPLPTPKAAPIPEPSSRPQEKDPAIDLSGFTWIENNYSRTTVALVRIREGEITFNAAARRQFAHLIDGAKTVDIGWRQNDGGVQIAFKLHEDQAGQYRVTNGKKAKHEFKISIRLGVKGLKVGVGPWPVELVDGVMFAEVGE